ncbi:MAG: hypothetical protein ACK55I_42705, partial [bacterium]
LLLRQSRPAQTIPRIGKKAVECHRTTKSHLGILDAIFAETAPAKAVVGIRHAGFEREHA